MLKIKKTLIKKDLPPEQFPKYVDTGLDVMLREMEKLGANRRYMEAKMAGAAHIIQYQSVSPTRDISSRNIQMAVEYLEKHKIKASVDMFGRETLAELDFNQIEKLV